MKKMVLIFSLLAVGGTGLFLNAGKKERQARKAARKEKRQVKKEKRQVKKEERKEFRKETCQSLHDGAEQLEKSPQDFRDGLVELEGLPGQLAQGAGKISEAIANIHLSRVDAKKQRDEIKSKKLSNLGMAKLEKSLLAALDELEQALIKLANTDDAGKCLSGILCNFLNVSNQKKDLAQKRIKIINGQITTLEDKILGKKVLLKSLPDRMRRAGKLIYWKGDCK